MPQVTQASKVWGEVPLPEDLEAGRRLAASQALLDDDEDFAADEASGGGLAPQTAAAAVLNSGQMVLIFLSSGTLPKPGKGGKLPLTPLPLVTAGVVPNFKTQIGADRG